ncbi:MAG TPA: alpha/beta fold hydrolase [Patescibacteria group bacterium]|jgi:pimeloyl-ACP methyl ester carboxylesterase|nr:alpha/beta fold hydrolase [Patescibacteria group bacterium]
MTSRRLGLTAALTVAPIAAWRFAQAYRARAGYPHRHPPEHDPGFLGLPFETVGVRTVGGAQLPAWWIPARDGAPGPAVLLIHGWESARDRTLPNAQILHAVGFHVLTLDIRGHGANPPEDLPLTAGEFGADALAGVHALLARRDVTAVGVLGHSMGGIGALLAAAAEPRVGAVIAASAPADPYRLTRQTFRLAHLPLPGPLAYPLAWLTTHVFLIPRGHTVQSVSAARAIETYRGPVLLIHGDADRVVPFSHLERLERVAEKRRARDPEAAPVEILVIPGGEHSWLYEDAEYRGTVARFLATALGGPMSPNEAEATARAVPASRLPQREHPFSAIEEEPGGFRTLWRAIRMAGGGSAR